MNLKNLIWKEEVVSDVKSKVPTFNETTQKETPKQTITPNTTQQTNFVVDNSVSEKVRSVYEDEFKKIDLPGIDYFEFHNGVMNAGVNPTSVTMMFNLLKGMNPTLDKTTLISQANNAVAKLDHFIDNAKTLSNNKKESVRQQILSNRQQLEERKMLLLEQIKQIQEEIRNIDNSLSNLSENEIKTIDDNFNGLLNVHTEYKNNINQIISILNAGL